MATPIIMPKQGNTVEECLLSEWKIKLGDNIAVGDIIADIETDKTTGEVEATASGIVLALFWEEGDLIPVFQNICVVGEAGEDVAEFAPTDEDGDDTATPVEEENAEDQAAPKDEPTAPVTAASGAAPLSPRARAFIKNHPTNLSAVVGSGADGRIIEKDVADAYHGGARLSTTAAAKLASGEGAPASGSGVGGMVMGNDMGQAAPQGAPAPASEDVITEIAFPNIRKIIAKTLLSALQTQAQYTLNAEADVTGLLALRKKIKTVGEALGAPNANLGDMVLFATIKALQRHPDMNAEFDGKIIRQHSGVNIGFACDTPRGLMVPVLHGAQNLGLGALSSAVKSLAKAAIDGTLEADALSGGTFTVSNLGTFGVTTFTPVINPPQVGILGVGKTLLRPVRTPGGIEHRDYMQFSLTCDHRVVDGAPGARFLQTFATIIENFELACITGQ